MTAPHCLAKNALLARSCGEAQFRQKDESDRIRTATAGFLQQLADDSARVIFGHFLRKRPLFVTQGL